ncbi:HtaA domain-containing protein [Georgenia sp. AZ-5]|uniref:HtaA domain-containing protein n=1 Tax=Georgenia sp. AZ-5 TaxID=3367526 RepID=UPI003754E6B1
MHAVIPTPDDETTSTAAGSELPRPGLTWGLKRSFIRYISSLPDGAHAETDGASLEPPSLFHFSLDRAELDRSTGRGTLRFRGDVRLSGHHRMLSVMIADPWVELRDDSATLTVVDANHWPDRSRRMPLASLSLPEPTATPAGPMWGPVPARLTREGTTVFNDQYVTGEEMDPAFILLPRDHV